jgi:hypothetical protein
VTLHSPSLFAGLVLVFGAYRLVRLAGWDEFPLAARVRGWVTGEHWVPGDTDALGAERGKLPSSDATDVRPAYRRPTLAHLIHCPFCLGWWISLAVYGAWLAAPRGTLYVLAPFALSGLVGLIAKNLDP